MTIPSSFPPAAWAFLGLCILALAVAIWMNNTRKPHEIPEFTPEAPAVPKGFRARLAKAERRAAKQRRAHAYEVHQHDQGVHRG